MQTPVIRHLVFTMWFDLDICYYAILNVFSIYVWNKVVIKATFPGVDFYKHMSLFVLSCSLHCNYMLWCSSATNVHLLYVLVLIGNIKNIDVVRKDLGLILIEWSLSLVKLFLPDEFKKLYFHPIPNMSWNL